MAAEAAVVIPALLAIALALVWLVALAATHLRTVDAAREVARSEARDDDRGRALSVGRRVAPDGAQITVRRDGDLVLVDVSADVRGPGGLLDFLPSVRVRSSATAVAEEQ